MGFLCGAQILSSGPRPAHATLGPNLWPNKKKKPKALSLHKRTKIRNPKNKPQEAKIMFINLDQKSKNKNQKIMFINLDQKPKNKKP